MNILETLNADLQEVKNKIKFAKAVELIVNAFNNKASFEFCLYNTIDVELFKDKLFSCGRLDFKLDDVKHYQDMAKDYFTEKEDEVKKIKSAIKLIEGFLELERVKYLDNWSHKCEYSNILHGIADELIK